MTKFECYSSGTIFGIIYTFETIKDGLKGHSHGPADAHNICVLRGEIKLIFDDQNTYLREGDIYDFNGARHHSVIALKPNSCILNLFLRGMPAEYKNLPKSELSGAFQI